MPYDPYNNVLDRIFRSSTIAMAGQGRDSLLFNRRPIPAEAPKGTYPPPISPEGEPVSLLDQARDLMSGYEPLPQVSGGVTPTEPKISGMSGVKEESQDEFEARYFAERGWSHGRNRAVMEPTEIPEEDRRISEATGAYIREKGIVAFLKTGLGRMAAMLPFGRAVQAAVAPGVEFTPEDFNWTLVDAALFGIPTARLGVQLARTSVEKAFVLALNNGLDKAMARVAGERVTPAMQAILSGPRRWEVIDHRFAVSRGEANLTKRLGEGLSAEVAAQAAAEDTAKEIAIQIPRWAENWPAGQVAARGMTKSLAEIQVGAEARLGKGPDLEAINKRIQAATLKYQKNPTTSNALAIKQLTDEYVAAGGKPAILHAPEVTEGVPVPKPPEVAPQAKAAPAEAPTAPPEGLKPAKGAKIPPTSTTPTPTPVTGWSSPIIKGKEALAESQSAGLPRGRFIALDKPFESPAHNVQAASKKTVSVSNVYDPDGLLGKPSDNVGKEFADQVNKTKPADIRQAYTDFLKGKGYDSYIRGIDGDPLNRELIVFKGEISSAIKPTFKDFLKQEDPYWEMADRPSEAKAVVRRKYERLYGKRVEAPAVPPVEPPTAEVPPAGPPKGPPEIPPAGGPGSIPPEPEFAANIRLSKYPEEIRDTLVQAAKNHAQEIDEARRGIRHDAQVLADAAGVNVNKIIKRWKPGTAYNDAEITAIRGALEDAGQKTASVVNDLKAGLDTTTNKLKLAVALDEQLAIQKVVSGGSSEAGRSLRIHRLDARKIAGSTDAEKITELTKRILQDNNIKVDITEIADALGKLDLNDPIQVNNFLKGLARPGAANRLFALFINSILSGPKSQIVNAVSNTINVIAGPLERAGAIPFHVGLAKIQGYARTRYLGEVTADAFGLVKGFKEGVKAGLYTIKSGGLSPTRASKWEFGKTGRSIITGKEIIDRPLTLSTTMLEAADSTGYAIIYRGAYDATAFRMVVAEGLKPGSKPFISRLAEVLVNPPDALLKEADRIAQYRLFRQPQGKTVSAILHLRESTPGMRYVIPFVNTSVNLVKYGLERSPLGIFNPKLMANLKSKNPEAADQLARWFLGSVAAGLVAYYFHDGKITGAAPTDPGERDRFYREGKQPHSVYVWGNWIQYQRLEPFNQLFNQVAIVVEAVNSKKKNVNELATQAVSTMTNNIKSLPIISGFNDMIGAIDNPETQGLRWLERIGSSLVVPFSALSRTVAQMVDQTIRQPSGFVEQVKANIPGLSRQVPAKVTALGEEAQRTSPAYLPINISQEKTDKLTTELGKLEYNTGFINDTIRDVALTKDEARSYQQQAGTLTKQILTTVIDNKDYVKLNDDQKKAVMDTLTAGMRDVARAEALRVALTNGDQGDVERKEALAKIDRATLEPQTVFDNALSFVPKYYRDVLWQRGGWTPETMQKAVEIASWKERDKPTLVAYSKEVEKLPEPLKGMSEWIRHEKPEVDAMLNIYGEVSTVKSMEALGLVKKYADDLGILYETVPTLSELVPEQGRKAKLIKEQDVFEDVTSVLPNYYRDYLWRQSKWDTPNLKGKLERFITQKEADKEKLYLYDQMSEFAKERYRAQHPDVDVALNVWGRVSTVQSSKAMDMLKARIKELGIPFEALPISPEYKYQKQKEDYEKRREAAVPSTTSARPRVSSGGMLDFARSFNLK